METLKNERMLLMVENENPLAQPLIVMLPQWSIQHIRKLPKLSQDKVYDEFAAKITDAWDELLRYEEE